MNKSIILLCKNHACNYNDKGDCKLDHVSLASEGSIVSKLICQDAKERPDEITGLTATS